MVENRLTAGSMSSATSESLTAAQLHEELDVLEARLEMPVDLAERLATADALDAELYRVLRRIRDLRWLQGD